MLRIVSFLLLFAFGNSLHAQGAELTLTAQYFVKKEGKGYSVYDPQIYASGWVGDKQGMWFFLYGEPGTNGSSDYFSLAAGPYFAVGNWIEAGIGVGIETFEAQTNKWSYMGRYIGQLRLGTIDSDDAYIETYYENGPSKEPWIQSNLALRLFQKPASWIGVMQQTGVGTGVKLKVDLGFIPLRIWVAPVMTGKYGRNAMFGGEVVFSEP